MKTLLKILFWLISCLVLGLALLIFIASLKDYRPSRQETVFKTDTSDIFPGWAEIDIMIWNIGYCGLGEDADFFYDGGTMVRSSKDMIRENMEGVLAELQNNDTAEFILLQEVDVNSKRSYGINQHDSIREKMKSYHSFFGMNYSVFYVPIPFAEPMGKVKSGILTLSKTIPHESVRWSFPGKFPWPKSLFMLDRCFLVNRYKLTGKKELLIINTHNSAYDTGGKLREQEMKYLKEFLLSEYEKGNYIIVGGDWNQSPPDFVPEYIPDIFDNEDCTLIPGDYLPEDWKWIYDKKVPTNRRVKTRYERGLTPTTIIDFYLLSPNVAAKIVNTIDKEFRNSDHQPVRLKVRLL